MHLNKKWNSWNFRILLIKKKPFKIEFFSEIADKAVQEVSLKSSISGWLDFVFRVNNTELHIHTDAVSKVHK